MTNTSATRPLSPLAQAVVDAHFGAPAVTTPNRPPLPAGEAVLYAAAQAMECPDGFLPYERELIAAALRAAADQVEHHWDGMECVDHLQAIAAELEGADG